MPDYQQGKIYQIWSPNTDKVYIGSTTQPLHKRMYEHNHGLTGKRYTNSYKVLECGDACIELIEEYPCAKKSELNRREGQIMRGYDNRVNKIIAGRTAPEWRADNKEQIAAQMKVSYQREDVKTQRKEYYLRKKEQIAAHQARPEVKARREARRQREDVKAYRAEQVKAYQARPEVKARCAAQARERYLRKKAEQQQTASA